ncbi:hypothetical protein [Xanthobacter versatilis]|uniref:hypothetical protein n=1 Tax=Xanthobacter autotrophicus (strain ATCC BAA-1158 / Py2) TaxID=78245 RepID=UPI00372897D4
MKWEVQLYPLFEGEALTFERDADRSSAAGDKDTTNALGKSTLIEIIDFCLASTTSPGKGLRVEALQGWAFTLELTIGGNDVAVT